MERAAPLVRTSLGRDEIYRNGPRGRACGDYQNRGFQMGGYEFLKSSFSRGVFRRRTRSMTFSKSSNTGTYLGVELMNSVTRLSPVNLLLHGFGSEADGSVPGRDQGRAHREARRIRP